jgi:hypothetical protein
MEKYLTVSVIDKSTNIPPYVVKEKNDFVWTAISK